MGNYCGVDSVRPVTSMTNRPRIGPEFQKITIESERFGQVLFTRKKQTEYNFIMRVRHDGAYSQINVDLTVLKQIVDMVLFPNFDLLLHGKPIIDIFDMADHSQVLIPVTNKRNRQPYSIKIYPFESYDSYIFKKGLYEIFLHNLLGPYARGIVNLQDYFVLDRSNEKALIFLYEPVETNLCNVIELKNKAGQGWSELEQLYMMRNILIGYETLNQKNIYHRDLRPGKIYYSKLRKQYLIGNLQSARIVMAVDLQRDALLTPRGVPFFNSENVNDIIKRGDRVGHYNVLQNDYIFLKKLMLYLNNCSLEDTHEAISHPILLAVYQRLNTLQPIQLVAAPIREFDYKIDDTYIAQRVQTHLASTNSIVNKAILLNSLFHLRQDEQYSRMAHSEIEANIQSGNQAENAIIFMRLGEYYASNNANSEDYFINALRLFVNQSRKSRKMGKFHQCVQLMRNAKICNDHIIDFNYRVMYLGEVAVVRAALGYLVEANAIITEALKEAATRGIPPKQQLQLLIAKGEICCFTGAVDECQKYMKFGLTICDDREYFEDIREQNGYKARLMRIIGISYVGQSVTKDQFLVMASMGLDNRTFKHLNKAQSYLIGALQLSQLSITEPVELASINLTLGQSFILRRDAYQAKKSFIRSVQYYLACGPDLNPLLLAVAFKQLAISQMMVGQLMEAQKSFISAYRIYNSQPDQQINSLLTQGYLGIVMIMQGRLAEGEIQANVAIQKLNMIAPGNQSVQMLLMEKMNRMTQATAIAMNTSPMASVVPKAPVTYSAMPNPLPDHPMLPPPPSAASAAVSMTAAPMVAPAVQMSGANAMMASGFPMPIAPVMPVNNMAVVEPIIPMAHVVPSPSMIAQTMVSPFPPGQSFVHSNAVLGDSRFGAPQQDMQRPGSVMFGGVPPVLPTIHPPPNQGMNMFAQAMPAMINQINNMNSQQNSLIRQPILIESRVNDIGNFQNHQTETSGFGNRPPPMPPTETSGFGLNRPPSLNASNDANMPQQRSNVSLGSYQPMVNSNVNQLPANLGRPEVNLISIGQTQGLISSGIQQGPQLSVNDSRIRHVQPVFGQPTAQPYNSNLRNTRPLNSNGALS